MEIIGSVGRSPRSGMVLSLVTSNRYQDPPAESHPGFVNLASRISLAAIKPRPQEEGLPAKATHRVVAVATSGPFLMATLEERRVQRTSNAKGIITADVPGPRVRSRSMLGVCAWSDRQ